MIDCITPATGCPTLECQQLTLQPVIREQGDGAAVEQRQ
jgi:hypothetical protein